MSGNLFNDPRIYNKHLQSSNAHAKATLLLQYTHLMMAQHRTESIR